MFEVVAEFGHSSWERATELAGLRRRFHREPSRREDEMRKLGPWPADNALGPSRIVKLAFFYYSICSSALCADLSVLLWSDMVARYRSICSKLS